MSQAVVVYDGVCNLCNGWVKFLLRHDPAARYRLAPMQGQAGAALMRAHGIDPTDPNSFLMVDARGAHVASTAMLRILVSLGGGWRLAAVLLLVPRPLRDWAYRHVASHRYQWFGRQESCPLPPPGYASRFLP